MNRTTSQKFSENADAVVYHGACLDFLKTVPNNYFQLIMTSPPYNIGKSYEKAEPLEKYLCAQAEVIKECVRCLAPLGSIVWEVGNFVNKDTKKSSIVPLDIPLYQIFDSLGLRLRNRIIWHFEHGLNCENRFSGRYETLLWFTHQEDYVFNLDPVRVPQKYPGKKYFRGPKKGMYSSNPLGKNPGDVWDVPNVKCNHPEKTAHPCQYPVELVERFVLSCTNPGDTVFDPYLGSGSTILAALLHDRRGMGCEIMADYCAIASERIDEAFAGVLKTRKMGTPIYNPTLAGNRLTRNPFRIPVNFPHQDTPEQMVFLEEPGHYPAKGE